MASGRAIGRSRVSAVFVACVASLIFGCGPKKPPEEPNATTTETSPKKDDGTSDVKWEGASHEDQQARQAGPPAGTQPHTPQLEQRRTDVYDKDATEIVLKRAARQVKEHCGEAKDENGKASGPWGKVNVTVNLGHNGHSKEVTIPAPYDGKPTGRCAVKAFSNLTFPPWSGADTPVDWEVEIVSPKK